MLGPLLFIIFINDLKDERLKGKIKLYADDAALFYYGKNEKENVNCMNDDLMALNDYFNNNKLTINSNKTKYMHFHNSRKKVEATPNVVSKTSIVERVEEFKYLGLYLDSHITWKSHIKHLSSKICAVIGMMHQIRHFMPRPIMLQIYFALVHSHISYLTGIWGAASSKYVKSIQILQNRALKIIFNLPRLHPTINLYVNHAKTVLPVMGLHDISIIMYVHKSLRNNTLKNMSFKSSDHGKNTRNEHKLKKDNVKSTYGLKKLSYMGPKLYNEVPTAVQNESIPMNFKKRLKEYLLQQDQIEKHLKMRK